MKKHENRSICVYCGSGLGNDPEFAEFARSLGRQMAQENVRLVFGGGNVGLMGEVSTALLDCGGQAIGITPKFLAKKEKPNPRPGLTLRIVRDMHVRKSDMFKYSDGFIALPGGVGTLEELIEQITWRQLGRHTKPIVVVNTGGFWDSLRDLLASMRERQFIREEMPIDCRFVDSSEDALAVMYDQWSREKKRDDRPTDNVLVRKFA